MKKIRYRGHIHLADEFTIPISWLSSHVVVSGQYQIGGKELLRKLAKEISERHPEVGILYISQLNKWLKDHYPWDMYYDITDQSLTLPYFYGNTRDEMNLKQWIAAIARPLGFSRDFEEQFTKYVRGGKLPETLFQLFKGFRKRVFKTKSIPGEDYYRLPDPAVSKDYWSRYKFSASSEKLNWVEDLLSGKNVFIDITASWNQPFHLSLILQNLRSRVSSGESIFSKIFIFVEEGAYQLFSRLLTHGIDIDRYNRFIKGVLESFKHQGISIIVEDDQPGELVKSMYELAELKVFFRLWYQVTKGLPLNEQESELIHTLEDREALIYSSN